MSRRLTDNELTEENTSQGDIFVVNYTFFDRYHEKHLLLARVIKNIISVRMTAFECYCMQ